MSMRLEVPGPSTKGDKWSYWKNSTGLEASLLPYTSALDGKTFWGKKHTVAFSCRIASMAPAMALHVRLVQITRGQRKQLKNTASVPSPVCMVGASQAILVHWKQIETIFNPSAEA